MFSQSAGFLPYMVLQVWLKLYNASIRYINAMRPDSKIRKYLDNIPIVM